MSFGFVFSSNSVAILVTFVPRSKLFLCRVLTTFHSFILSKAVSDKFVDIFCCFGGLETKKRVLFCRVCPQRTAGAAVSLHPVTKRSQAAKPRSSLPEKPPGRRMRKTPPIPHRLTGTRVRVFAVSNCRKKYKIELLQGKILKPGN